MLFKKRKTPKVRPINVYHPDNHPQKVRTQLWPHQANEADRLARIPRVLCSWEMGTGKTLFGIERDLRFREMFYESTKSDRFKTLVVAPSATHISWYKALVNETGLRVKIIDRKNRAAFLESPEADYYIMHWEVLQIESTALNFFGFQHIILDEVHRIKNRDTKRTKAAKSIKTPVATSLSGSPVANKPHDLWSIINHLYPKEFSSFWKFCNKYIEMTREPHRGYWTFGPPNKDWIENREKIIGGFSSIIQVKNLPYLKLDEPIHIEINCELGPKQRKSYNKMDSDMIVWLDEVGGREQSNPLVASIYIAKLQRLQQFAIASMVADGDQYKMSLPSAKLEAVKDFISDSEEQFVVFSQFKQPFHLLKEMLKDEVGLYTGGMKDDERNANVERFKNGFYKVLCMTYSAGGEGMDGLQHVCRNVILLDRAWAPTTNDQAIARVNRAGQTMPVNVIDVIATDTVDRDRMFKIAEKARNINLMMGT